MDSNTLSSFHVVLYVRVQDYRSKNRETRETREKNAPSPKLGTTRTGF